MIDVENEHLLTMTEAARSISRGGVHVSTLHRWHLRGCRGVRLETVLIGGRRYTSKEALQRFFARVTAAADGQVVRAEMPPTVRNDIDAALDEYGI